MKILAGLAILTFLITFVNSTTNSPYCACIASSLDPNNPQGYCPVFNCDFGNCKQLSTNQYVVTPCSVDNRQGLDTVTSTTIVGTCTSKVTSGYYVASPCLTGSVTLALAGSDISQMPCTQAVPANSYVSKACVTGSTFSAGNNTILSPCAQTIPLSSYLSGLCQPGTYNGITIGSDHKFSPCISGNTAYSFVSLACNIGNIQSLSIGSVASVSPCSSIPQNNGSYVTQVCVLSTNTLIGALGSDVKIADCTKLVSFSLPSGNPFYISTICQTGNTTNLGSNTVFKACSFPAVGQYVSKACVIGTDLIAGSDAVLSNCIPSNMTISSSTIITSLCVQGSPFNLGTPTAYSNCSSPQIVPAGFYYNISGGCTSGNASSVGINYSIVPCPSGFYCLGGMSNPPTLCQLGNYCPLKSSSAVPCPINFYCPTTSLIVPCEASSSSVAIGATNPSQCKCINNHYRFTSPAINTTSCSICPQGASCLGFNISLGVDATPISLPGFTASQTLGTFFACSPPSSCLSGSTYFDLIFLNNATNTLYNNKLCFINLGRDCMSDVCSKGYSGELCGQCAKDGDFLSYRSIGACVLCSSVNNGLDWLILIAMLIVASLLIYGFTRLNLDFRILVMTFTFIQTVASFSSIGLKWTSIVKSIFNVASSLNANIDLIKPECFTPMPFFSKWIIIQMVPIFIITAVTVFYFLYIKCKKSSWKYTFHFDDYIKYSVSVIDLSYFFVAKNTLEIFACSKLSNNNNVLIADPSIQCDISIDQNYYRLYILGILGIVFYIIGIPILLSSIMIYHRKEITEELEEDRAMSTREIDSNKSALEVIEPGSAKSRFGTLYNSFKAKYFLWKIIITFRKLLIVSVIVLLPSENPTAEALAVVIILQISLFIQHYANPYQILSNGRDPLNALEFFTLISTMIVLSLGMLMDNVNTISNGSNVSHASLLNFLSVLVIGLVCVLLASYVWILYRYGKKGSKQILRAEHGRINDKNQKNMEMKKNPLMM